MPQFMLTYLGGDQPSSPEEGKAHMEKYMAWLAGLGAAAVSPAKTRSSTTWADRLSRRASAVSASLRSRSSSSIVLPPACPSRVTRSHSPPRFLAVRRRA